MNIGFAEKIKSVCVMNGINEVKIVFKHGNKINKYENNMKDKRNNHECKDIVYRIKCKYILDTLVWFIRKNLLPQNNLKIENETNTALSIHLKENKHVADWEELVLYTQKNINLKEGMEIFKHLECVMKKSVQLEFRVSCVQMC